MTRLRLRRRRGQGRHSASWYSERSRTICEHRLGDEVVERPALADPRPQVGAGHLEPGHLDAHPLELLGQLDRCAGTIDDHQDRALDDLVVALPGGDARRGVVTDDGVQLGARDASRPARPACRRCSWRPRGGSPCRWPAGHRPRPLRPAPWPTGRRRAKWPATPASATGTLATISTTTSSWRAWRTLTAVTRWPT